MSATGRAGFDTAGSLYAAVEHIATNLLIWAAALFGPKRRLARRPRYRALLHRHQRHGLIVLGLALAAMILLDPFVGAVIAALPRPVVNLFAAVTDFGLSGVVLYPVGIGLVVMAALTSPALAQMTRSVLAALVVRLGFIFVAVGLTGLIATTLKRLIGRVRPSSARGAFAFEPFSWRPDYASLPSGHSVTAFSVLVAFGFLFPRLRPLLWIYAVIIAVSRVVVSAHFPSDVIVGAAFGALGAVLVREWFASRRLGFFVDSEGVVRSFPGPSFTRARRAIGTALAR
ncbi:MAG: phosphatase PAP2 family protein [Xanthobacteraceae bacterium]